MEPLPTWLHRCYTLLSDEFGQEGADSFSWDDAIATLDVSQGTGADALSTLIRFGFLWKEVNVLDQRTRAYRLVDVTKATELDKQLESWRRSAATSAPPLIDAIDRCWARCRAVLERRLDLSATSQWPGQLVAQHVNGNAKRSDLRIVKNVDIKHLEEEKQVHAAEILKLFDASHNGYRSITNVLLEYHKLQQDLTRGVYDLPISEYVSVDGVPLKRSKPVANKALCPICRRYRQTHSALALITGGPKNDSAFEVYRGNLSKRAQNVKVCAHCFLAGWIDLPASKIEKVGQGIDKEREYLFITTPFARSELQQLLDLIAGRIPHSVQEEEEPDLSTEEEDDLSLSAINRFVEEKFGFAGYDSLSVLGLSKGRLQELRGFALPGATSLLGIVAVRVPVQRLVGEDKISGAVRRELMKAAMYDFWQITGGALHYNRIVPDAQFSVAGRPVTKEEMERASVAYRIADRYARIGRFQQLHSGLFMLLLSRPREAANRILRAKHRNRTYAPGSDKVKEVIEMTEKIAQPDWKFDLGLRIVATLVDTGLLKKAQGFRGPGPNDVYSGVELVKWLQRLKMIRDETTARAWGNMLLNALKRGDLAYRDYIQSQGGQISAPGKETVGKILNLVDGEDGIIRTCVQHGGNLPELARDLANMDYYLLFHYNQRKAAQGQEQEETK